MTLGAEGGTSLHLQLNMGWRQVLSQRQWIYDFQNFNLGAGGFVLSLRFSPWPWVFRLLFPNADHLLWWFKHIPMGLFGFTNNALQNPGQEGHTPISRVNTWEEGGRRMWRGQGQPGRCQQSFNFFLSKEVRHYRYLK